MFSNEVSIHPVYRNWYKIGREMFQRVLMMKPEMLSVFSLSFFLSIASQMSVGLEKQSVNISIVVLS